MQKVWDAMSVVEKQYFLLVYAFSGRDTVSLLFGKGRIAVLKSLINPRKTGNIWRPPIESIDGKGVKPMQLVYGEPTMSLGDQRYNAYREQIMKGTFRPEILPQLSGVAVQHGRRMFTQLREWVLLDVNLTIGPYRYG